MAVNNLHLQLQSAYKRNHSTESALLKVKNDILMNMDAQEVTLLILLDLSAAFETVNHGILLERLRSRFGVDETALEWFKSYLSGRLQRITVNGGTSATFPLDQGVPQGSCLGPVWVPFSLQCTQASCLRSSGNISQVYIAMQMTHSCT